MKYLFSILFLFVFCSSGCVVDDAFGAVGDEVLGVEVPGQLTIVWPSSVSGRWSLALFGSGGFTWIAAHYCSLHESSHSDGQVPAEAEQSAGVRPVTIDVPQSELAGLCTGGDGIGNLKLNVAGRVLHAVPTDGASVDRLVVDGSNKWATLVASGQLRCGRYSRGSGVKLADVPCTDGIGGTLAPSIQRRGLSVLPVVSPVDEWPEFEDR